MGGRPPLPLGTAGKIRTKQAAPGRWRAMTLFRDHDGTTRQLERSGSSQAKATRALNEAIRDRKGADSGDVLTGRSRVKDAAAKWLTKVTRETSDTTLENYRRRLNNHVLPALGELLLRECDVPRIAQFFETLADKGLSAYTRRGIRTVVSGILEVAVMHKALAHNPVREIGKIKGSSPRAATAMTVEALSDFLAKMDANEAAARNDIPDFVRFLFGTGVRFGEALAVRWREVNLSDEVVTVDDKVIPPQSAWVNGTIVVVTGKGVVRHDGKTETSNRIVGLPKYLHDMLLVRKPLDALDDDPVFPSGTLGWKHPSNIQRSTREMRNRIGYPQFTTHVGRKTVATVLDDAGQSARQVADQLGHSNPAMTLNVYMGRGQANPDAAKALDRIHRTP